MSFLCQTCNNRLFFDIDSCRGYTLECPNHIIMSNDDSSTNANPPPPVAKPTASTKTKSPNVSNNDLKLEIVGTINRLRNDMLREINTSVGNAASQIGSEVSKIGGEVSAVNERLDKLEKNGSESRKRSGPVASGSGSGPVPKKKKKAELHPIAVEDLEPEGELDNSQATHSQATNKLGLINMNRLRGTVRYHSSLYSLFACIAIKLFSLPQKVTGVGRYVQSMLKSFPVIHSVEPVDYEKLRLIEQYSNLAFLIYLSNQQLIYCTAITDIGDRDCIHLLWLNDRYHFIKDRDLYFQYFNCPGCDRGFRHKTRYHQHLTTCRSFRYYQQHGKQPEVLFVEETVLEGRWVHSFVDPVEQLKKLVGMRVKIKQISSPYMCCFDTESVLFDRENADNMVNDTRNYTFMSTHNLYMIGSVSNIPGFRKVQVFFRKDSTDNAMIYDFVSYLLKMSDKAYKLNKKRLAPFFKDLWQLRDRHARHGSPQFVNWIENLIRQLMSRLRVLVCVTYNGFRYDVPLLKHIGLLALLDKFDGIEGSLQRIRLMKRSKTTYLSIQSRRLKIVDQLTFAGVRCSLRTLLRDAGFAEAEQKSYFPYSYVVSYEKLIKPGFAKYGDFWDDLGGDNLLDRERIEYEEKMALGMSQERVLKSMSLQKPPETGIRVYWKLIKQWTDGGCKNMMDVAIMYIHGDVKPTLKYAPQNRELYLDWANVDLYADFLSITQFTFMYCQRFIRNNTMQYFVHLPLDIRKMLQRDMTGGLRLLDPSINQKAREYQIPNGEPLKYLLGFDCNNMYGKEFGGYHYVGSYVDRKEEERFEPKFMGSKHSLAIEWLMWENTKLHCGEIHHQYNFGENWVHLMPDDDTAGSDDDDDDDGDGDNQHKREQKVFAKRVDGYYDDGSRVVVYEHFGEWWHGLCDDHLPGREDEIMAGGRTAKQLHDEAMDRIHRLEQKFDEVKFIWSCQWERMKKTDADVRRFMHHFSFGPDVVKRHFSSQELIEHVQDERLHGFICCDVTTPDSLRVPATQHGHSDFPLIIKHATIGRGDIDSVALEYCKKYDLLKSPCDNVICSYFANNQWFTTKYIKFVVDHGCVVTRVYRLLQFRYEKVYDKFVDTVTRRRIQADLENKPETAKLMKLLINGCFGGTLLNVSKHFTSKLVSKDHIKRVQNDPFVTAAQPVGIDDAEDLYEVQIKKKKIVHKNLIQVGFTILQNSKVRLMSFKDFIELLDPRCYELASCDTDSLYVMLSREDLRSCVPTRNLKEFDRKAAKILVDESDPFSKRKPGLFHLETKGQKAVFLAPKLYVVVTDEEGGAKIAARGIPQKINNSALLTFERFRSLLFDEEIELPVVRASGFIQKQNMMCTYIMNKSNLNSVFVKRRVLPNNYSTETYEKL